MVYMDSMAFGMGMCCLQVTFQCCNIAEARHFYDQLAVMAPIMVFIACVPVMRGERAIEHGSVVVGIVGGNADISRLPMRAGRAMERHCRFGRRSHRRRARSVVALVCAKVSLRLYFDVYRHRSHV
jgi:hypothetical protein